MRRMMRLWTLVLAVGLVGAVGCTEPNAAATGQSSEEGNNGWEINQDAEASDVSIDVSTPQADTSGDTPPSNNGGDDVGPTPEDTGSTEDTGTPIDPQDTGAPTDPQDTGTEPADTSGQACTSNSECSSGQVCCPEGWNGDATCTARDNCQIGGICESDSDCAPNEGCCDQIDICSTRCSGGGGGGGGGTGSGDPCTNNSECSGNEICCSNSNETLCTTRDSCMSGGICETDSHCRNNETCCELGQLGTRCIESNWCF